MSDARCLLRGCLDSEGVEDLGLESKPILHHVLLLRRVRSEGAEHSYHYRLESRLVAVGCTCVRPISQQQQWKQQSSWQIGSTPPQHERHLDWFHVKVKKTFVLPFSSPTKTESQNKELESILKQLEASGSSGEKFTATCLITAHIFYSQPQGGARGGQLKT